MLLPLLGIIIGILIGIYMPLDIPTAYTSYMSIAILAALDSVFGGIRASLEKNFKTDVFTSGFFGNAILAAVLTYIGDRLGVPIYFAAIVVFGSRLFQNFAQIRRHFLNKYRKKENI